ncbi:unnamed protein product [Penicillium glandicola]
MPDPDQGPEAHYGLAQWREFHFPVPEDPVYGVDEDVEGPPGFWANRAKTCPWPRMRNQFLTRGTLLNRLRRGKRKVVDGKSFDAQVTRTLANCEALLAHAVGEKVQPGEECDHCYRGDGKFLSCVMVPGENCCTSCFWDKQRKRCSFSQAPDVSTVEGENSQVLKPNDSSEANASDNEHLQAIQRNIRAMEKERKALKEERKALAKDRKEFKKDRKKFKKDRKEWKAAIKSLRLRERN